MVKNKPKVSTNSGMTYKEKRKKIIQCLKAHPEALQPMYISFITRINVNTVKTILRELLEQGYVRRNPKQRGFYDLVEKTKYGINSYKMQNIELAYHPEKIDIDKRIKEESSLNDLVKFRFEIGKKSNKASMRISTDYPFEVTSLGIIVRLFQELVYKHANLCPSLEEITLTTLELNNDDYSLRLDGFKCIRLNSLIAEFKMYQKKGFVREEFKIKVPVGFDVIKRILRQGIVNGELYEKLNQQDRKIKKLIDSINILLWDNQKKLERMFQLLRKL